MSRHWNYRVIETYCGNGEYTWCVHEVYYGEAGKPASWSVEPVSLYTEEPDGLQWQVEKIQEVIKKPMLRQFYNTDTCKFELEEV